MQYAHDRPPAFPGKSGIRRRVVRPPGSLVSACSPPPPTPHGGLVGRRALGGDVGLTAYVMCIPPELVGATRNPVHCLLRPLRRLRWLPPVRDAGFGGRYFVPSSVRKHFSFWNDVTLQDQSLRDTWLSCRPDGVGVHVFLIGSRKAPPLRPPL